MLKKNDYMNKSEASFLTKNIINQCKTLKDDLANHEKFKTKDDWKKMYYIKEGGDQDNE